MPGGRIGKRNNPGHLKKSELFGTAKVKKAVKGVRNSREFLERSIRGEYPKEERP